MNCIHRKLRQRRDARAIERALRTAPSAVEQELRAITAHTGLRIN